jgi:hypothetical protein
MLSNQAAEGNRKLLPQRVIGLTRQRERGSMIGLSRQRSHDWPISAEERGGMIGLTRQRDREGA